MKTILLSFNLSNERISFYYLCLSSSLFFFFFLCHIIFAHDVPSGIFAMPMVFSPNFCLDCPCGLSIQWGFFCHNFFQAAFLGFQPSRPFFFLNVILPESIHVNWAKHLFPIQICDSCSTSKHDFLNCQDICVSHVKIICHYFM